MGNEHCDTMRLKFTVPLTCWHYIAITLTIARLLSFQLLAQHMRLILTVAIASSLITYKKLFAEVSVWMIRRLTDASQHATYLGNKDIRDFTLNGKYAPHFIPVFRCQRNIAWHKSEKNTLTEISTSFMRSGSQPKFTSAICCLFWLTCHWAHR